jgi:glycosyltransferase involved in cell wall biosynthesis
VSPDLLSVNSFFGRPFSMAVLLAWWSTGRPCPLLWAPRGEFSPGALDQKPRRKRAYIRLVKQLGLPSHALWQASSPLEAGDIRRELTYKSRVAVARPILRVPSIATAMDVPTSSEASVLDFPAKPQGRLRIVFLSRISPTKNLPGALAMLRSLRGAVTFTIHGPIEDRAEWAECQRTMATLPPQIRVEYAGTIPHEEVVRQLAAHDVFLLPTFGENFGHVIAEALQAGCPVVISDRTPWRQLAERGLGWDLPLSNPAAFTAVLQQCVDMTAEEFASLRRRVAAYGLAVGMDRDILNQHRQMLNAALRKRSIGADETVYGADRLPLFSGDVR